MKDNLLVLDLTRLKCSHLSVVMEHCVTVFMQWIRQFQIKLNYFCQKLNFLLCDSDGRSFATLCQQQFYFVNQ